MTLILSAVTPKFVLQVSDRRVTSLALNKDEEIQVLDSTSNKAVMFGDRLVFSFTGLANLGGVPTDIWLSEVLVKLRPDSSVPDILDSIAKSAQAALAAVKLDRRLKHLAFCGVGWQMDGGKPASVLCAVTNFQDMYGQTLSVPNEHFRLTMDTSSSQNEFSWTDNGLKMTPKESSRLHRLLCKCGGGPNAFVRLFSDAIRRVALRSKLVGKDLMVVAIPEEAAFQNVGGARSPTGLCLGPSVGPISVFEYLPRDSTPVSYTPLYVHPGLMTIGAVEVKGPGPVNNQLLPRFVRSLPPIAVSINVPSIDSEPKMPRDML